MAIIPTISLIGAGNMGSSLIGGLIAAGHPNDKLWAADTSLDKLDRLKATFNIHTTLDNTEAVITADVVIFAVKPLLFAPVAKELAQTLQIHRPLIISIAAGIQVATMVHYLGNEAAIVRAMPNTPALVRLGATALFANAAVSNGDRKIAEKIMSAVGLVKWLKTEALMDSITALSGSGPAYFFLIMEALEQAAVELGLPVDIAHLFTLQTALGAANMAIKSDKSLAELRKEVTSTGGTTEKAIAVLEEYNIRQLLLKTLETAKLRSEELAQQSGDQ
jgi:pyrroline-5-carboxylate reductase